MLTVGGSILRRATTFSTKPNFGRQLSAPNQTLGDNFQRQTKFRTTTFTPEPNSDGGLNFNNARNCREQMFEPARAAVVSLDGSARVFDNDLFCEHDEKIHGGGEYAQNEGRCHDEIELEDLPAIYNELAEPGFGNDVLSHDGADPRHADADLQHADKFGKR